MFDFPNSPSTGQTVTSPTGAAFSWDGTKWIPGAVAASTVPMAANVGRNLIHNSLFNVAQRGAGPWTASTNYTTDRWILLLNTDAASVTQSILGDADRASIGDENALRASQNVFTGNAAAAAFNFVAQRIEKVSRLSGKTVTISLWARCTSGALKLGVALSQIFGTGGSPSATVFGAGVAVTLATTWARYTVTLSLPSMSGQTVGSNGDDYTQLEFWHSSGATNATRAGNIGVQSGTIQVWGCQCEIGSVATPLEKLEYADDLRHCQRFYQVGNFQMAGYCITATGTNMSFLLPALMRATPTVTPNFTTGTNTSGAVVQPMGANGLVVGTNVSATGGFVLAGTFTASADL